MHLEGPQLGSKVLIAIVQQVTSALLFTLAEVSPAACTCLRYAWSRPSTVGGTSAQPSTWTSARLARTWKVVLAVLEGDAAFSLPAERDVVAVAA